MVWLTRIFASAWIKWVGYGLIAAAIAYLVLEPRIKLSHSRAKVEVLSRKVEVLSAENTLAKDSLNKLDTISQGQQELARNQAEAAKQNEARINERLSKDEEFKRWADTTYPDGL